MRLGQIGLLLLAVVVLFLRVGDRLAEPFGGGHEANISGRYLAGILRSWEGEGFARRRAAPILTPRRSPEAKERLYANHPVLSYYIFQGYVLLCGRSELGHRVFGLGLIAIFLLVIGGFASRQLGLPGLVGALAALVSAGFVVTHGVVPTYEPFLLVFGSAALVLVTRERPPPSFAIPVLLFLAGSVDWAGFFLVIPVILAHRLARGCWPDRRRVLGFLAATGLSILIYLGLVVVWKGGIAEGFERMRQAGGNAVDTSLIFSVATWKTIGRFFLLDFGRVATALACPGIVLVSLPGSDLRVRAVIVASLVWGAMNVLAFPMQAIWHEYWLWPFWPAIILAIGVLAQVLHRRIGWFVLLVLAVLARDAIVIGDEQVDAIRRESPAALAGMLEDRFGTDCLYLIVGPSAAVYYYLDGEVVDNLEIDQRLGDLIEDWEEEVGGTERLVILAPEAPGAADPRRATWLERYGLELEHIGALELAHRRRSP